MFPAGGKSGGYHTGSGGSFKKRRILAPRTPHTFYLQVMPGKKFGNRWYINKKEPVFLCQPVLADLPCQMPFAPVPPAGKANICPGVCEMRQNGSTVVTEPPVPGTGIRKADPGDSHRFSAQ